MLLSAIVRDALRSPSAKLVSWNARSITFVDPTANPGNGGLYRVSGTAWDGDAQRRWSVVVKLLKNSAGTVMPGGHVIQAAEAADTTARGNLMFRQATDGGEELVAVDWAFVGPAALGEELAPLVVGSALQGAVALDELDEVERRALREYLAGLRAAGWAGDERLVRPGYTASAALRYGFIAVADILRSTFDAEQAAHAERAQGRPFAAILAERAALAYWLLDRADEALAMVR